MGGTAAVAAAADFLTGGKVKDKLMSSLMPKPDKPPGMPKMDTPEKDSAAAAERQRKKNVGAYGRSDTILTSPQGVLGSSSTTGGGKTLLGA